MEDLLRSNPNTSALHKYLAPEHRSIIDISLFSDTTPLYERYGLLLPFHAPLLPVAINCLWITTFGRFGNLIIQMGHALDVAKRLGVKKVFFERSIQEPGVFEETEPCVVDGIHLIADTLAKPASYETTMYGTFWSLHNFSPTEVAFGPRDVVPSEAFFTVLSSYIRDHIKKQNECDVVVHFRGGDVFRTDVPASYYAQPPLSFYIKATLLALGDSKGFVFVVFEDMRNPVVQPFVEWLTVSSVLFRMQSGDLRDDLRVMFGAHTIVSSFGTFVPAVMKLSKTIRRIYTFDNPEIYNPWNRFRKDVELLEFTDVSGGYIKRGEWLVSPDQCALMCSFHATNVQPLHRN